MTAYTNDGQALDRDPQDAMVLLKLLLFRLTQTDQTAWSSGLTLLLRIWDVQASNLGSETGFPD
jgi:hypothetical protein